MDADLVVRTLWGATLVVSLTLGWIGRRRWDRIAIGSLAINLLTPALWWFARLRIRNFFWVMTVLLLASAPSAAYLLAASIGRAARGRRRWLLSIAPIAVTILATVLAIITCRAICGFRMLG